MSITSPSIENQLDALRAAVHMRMVYEAALDELALVTVGVANDRQREVLAAKTAQLASGFPIADFETSMVGVEDMAHLNYQLGR